MKSRITLLAVVFMWLAETGNTASFQYAVNGVPFDTDGLTHYVASGTVTLDLMCSAVSQDTFYDGEIIFLMRNASLTGTHFNPAAMLGQWHIDDLGWIPSCDLGITDSDGEWIEGQTLLLYGDNFKLLGEGNLWTLTFQIPAMSKVVFFDWNIEERFALAAIPEPAMIGLLGLGGLLLRKRRDC